MVLLDTNIFIYLANGTLSPKVVKNIEIAFASIIKIEALGYSKISATEQSYLEELFSACYQIDLDEAILDRAVNLRLRQSLSLGDAIVAASAIENDCELWTANTNDFKGVENLKISNPLDQTIA